jgi:hypothetical protein
MIAASTAIKWRIIMKLVSFAASGRDSYGAVVGDGVFDLGRRLGDRYPTLRAAIARRRGHDNCGRRRYDLVRVGDRR